MKLSEAKIGDRQYGGERLHNVSVGQGRPYQVRRAYIEVYSTLGKGSGPWAEPIRDDGVKESVLTSGP